MESTLFESAEYFMYSFIPDKTLDQFPAAVKNKRSYYISLYKQIRESGCFSEADCMRIIDSAIYSRHSMSGKEYLLEVKLGNIPVVAGWIAIVSSILGVLSAIAKFFEKIFGNSEEETNEKSGLTHLPRQMDLPVLSPMQTTLSFQIQEAEAPTIPCLITASRPEQSPARIFSVFYW